MFLASKISRRLNVSPPTIEEPVMKGLMTHDWPGNIRELENTLENMILLSDSVSLSEDDLSRQFCFSQKKSLIVDPHDVWFFVGARGKEFQVHVLLWFLQGALLVEH